MRSCKTICWLVVIGLPIIGATESAEACPVCIAYPQKSAADYLIESSSVALAREDPDEAFAFAPVEILKGEQDGEKIDLFLDSVTRRILSTDQRRHVILVQASQDGSWRSLGLASATFEEVVRRIVLVAPEWSATGGDNRRVEFFLPLFGHKDAQVNALSYQEVARAPYDAIRRLSRAVPRNTIEPILSKRQYIQWRSLAIIMLANRGEAKDREYLVDSFHKAERFSLTTNLAAWTTALIELEGADAVSLIEGRYFRNVDRKPQELSEVVKAFSLHGTEGHTHLRDSIVESYAVLIDVHPAMAPRVAADLLAWKRSDLTAELSRIEAAGAIFNDAEKGTIRRYLRFSTLAESGSETDD